MSDSSESDISCEETDMLSMDTLDTSDTSDNEEILKSAFLRVKIMTIMKILLGMMWAMAGQTLIFN
jgi:hypothetical protein